MQLIIIYVGLQDLILLFKIPLGTRKDFFKVSALFEYAPSKRFASPVMCAKNLLLENCASLGYYATRIGNFFTRRFGTTYWSHFQGSRTQNLSYNINQQNAPLLN